jgi:hypothetical protein
MKKGGFGRLFSCNSPNQNRMRMHYSQKTKIYNVIEGGLKTQTVEFAVKFTI